MQKVALSLQWFTPSGYYPQSAFLAEESVSGRTSPLMVSKTEWHRWAHCRLNSLKSNMSRDSERGRCQIFNSLSTYASSRSAYSSAALLLVHHTKQYKHVKPLENLMFWSALSIQICSINFIKLFNWISRILTHAAFLNNTLFNIKTECLSLNKLSKPCGPKKKKLNRKLSAAQSVHALWCLPLKHCHTTTAFVFF